MELEEVRAEVVLDKPFARVFGFVEVINILDIIYRYVDKGDVGDHVTNAEAFEGHLAPIVREAAQELVSGPSESADIFRSHNVRYSGFYHNQIL